jgi:surface antigen
MKWYGKGEEYGHVAYKATIMHQGRIFTNDGNEEGPMEMGGKDMCRVWGAIAGKDLPST